MQVPRWTSVEPTAAERGHAFGRALAPAIANTVAVYRRMFREDVGLDDAGIAARGRDVEAVIRAFRPQLAVELEGIARGAGQSPALLFAANARTELLSGGVVAGATAGECSTIGVVAEDGRRAILAQTWDFHPALAASRVAWTIRRADGSSFTGLTEAGLVAKLGVNSAGVAVGMNFLTSDRDSGAGGVPVHVLARVLIEEAGTLAQARALMAQTPMTSSTCLTVAGPDDDGTVGVIAFERWPDGLAELPGEGTPRRVIHTNHFVGDIPAVDTLLAGPGGEGTRSRYEQLADAVGAEARCDLATITRQLSSSTCPPGGQAIFRAPDEDQAWLHRSGTLATVAFEVPTGRFWLRGDLDADAPLEAVA